MYPYSHWEKLCELHSRTKHYLLIAEELSEEGDVFLQPLKEHRDAYDHIIRAQGAFFRNDFKSEEERNAYIEKNMDKAYGHEYRAFFDTADWLSFICRRNIRLTLRAQSQKDLKVFNEYESIKELINKIPLEIATLREGKDIADNQSNDAVLKVGKLVADYCQTLDLLINAYITVQKKFEKA